MKAKDLGQLGGTGDTELTPVQCLRYRLLSSIVEALGPETSVLGDQWLWERTGSLEWQSAGKELGLGNATCGHREPVGKSRSLQ